MHNILTTAKFHTYITGKTRINALFVVLGTYLELCYLREILRYYYYLTHTNLKSHVSMWSYIYQF